MVIASYSFNIPKIYKMATTISSISNSSNNSSNKIRNKTTGVNPKMRDAPEMQREIAVMELSTSVSTPLSNDKSSMIEFLLSIDAKNTPT